MLAGAAPRACRAHPARAPARRRPRRRRLRRRPDGLRRRDAAHPGGADRGRRAPRAREPARAAVREAGSSSRTRCAPATGAKVRVVGRPIPARSRPFDQSEAREIFELPQDGRGARSSPARSPARSSLNELVVGDVRRRSGRRSCTSPAARDFDSVRRRVQRSRLPRDPRDRAHRRRLLGGRPRARALGQRRSGRSPPPASRRSSCRTRSRPATTRRRTPSTSCGGRRDHGARARPRRRARPSSARCSTTPRGSSEMGEAMLRGRAARRGRGDRRGADRACARESRP